MAAAGFRGRVLLVQDDELLRWTMERRLEKNGLAVTCACSVDEAAAVLCGQAHDVIVTDPRSCGEAGLAIAASARQQHPETQVIVVADPPAGEAVLSALRLGASDFFEKPLDLEPFALAVETALGKAALMRDLIQLSRTDGLTGLFNQRHFSVVLEAEINRARRQSRPLSLLLVDVDEFKRYNDRFGHLAGDDALARIASCLQHACRRDIDTAFRYGGDEFILVVPEADQATAAEIAARARSLLLEAGISLSVSIGVASLREGQDLKAFIREADLAMYRDKGGAGAALPQAS